VAGPTKKKKTEVGEYLFLAYGVLAGIALWATWPCKEPARPWEIEDFALLWIGLWLVIGWAISNALDWYAPEHWAPGPYTFIEVMVAFSAAKAWAEHRYPALIALVAITLLSIGFNAIYASHHPPSDWQTYLWKTATNACFAAECLIAIRVGVSHGYRIGRFSRRLHLRRPSPQPDVARKDGES
jgi:hypothetical protein